MELVRKPIEVIKNCMDNNGIHENIHRNSKEINGISKDTNKWYAQHELTQKK